MKFERQSDIVYYKKRKELKVTDTILRISKGEITMNDYTRKGCPINEDELEYNELLKSAISPEDDAIEHELERIGAF